MAIAVPVENIYYLLSYAWDHYNEGEEIDLSATACPDLLNLLAKVLANGIERLARTGFEREYLPFQETTSRLKGRILVAESYRRMTHRAGRMECRFDELCSDTPANRVLRRTADKLLRGAQLTPENHHAVRRARDLLPVTSAIRVSDSVFRRIQIHRNTRKYRLLLHVCQLIHSSLLPEEDEGSRRFRDILRDETIMHRLFEHFVLNFARRHCGGANVRAMPITWQGEWGDDAACVLPQMVTDVTVEWPDRKLILDCKFYREALVSRDGRYRLHSSHLYQLNAYLQNKARDPGWSEVEGILLYPAVDHCLDLEMILLKHRVRIVSVDLDRNWREIHDDLISVFAR